MYPISALFADRLRRPDRTFLVKASVNGQDYDNTKIVDFQIENNLSLSDEFQIGTAIPSKLTIKLRTSDIVPPNAQIIPYLSLSIADMTWNEAKYPWKELAIPWAGGGTDWMPMGEFYVDDRVKVNDTWVYTCYDKLVFADVAYVSSLTYPATQQAVFNEILGRLGWQADSSVVINPGYMIQAGPAGFTMRQVLAFIAAANSASVMVGKDGKIKFKRFAAADQPVFAMTHTDYARVKQTNPVKTYSRVVVTYDTEDGLTYEAGSGSDANTLFIENPFMTQSMVNNLQATLNGFSYLPITMDARGYPQLEQGDVISYEVYEGRTWNDTTVPWNQLDIPWNGMKKHQTLILHQVLSFAGGLKMTLEAPSQSDQKSEFGVDGSLTKAVNDLNKNAVKEGKAYFGATITRTEGLTIEREDHLSKAVFNSDELTFYQGSAKALWFDLPAKKFKFGGDLEAVGGTFTGTLQGVDGVFTGTLQAVNGTFTGNLQAAGGTFTGTLVGVNGTFSGTITASTINGSDIIGGVFRTATTGRRIQISSNGLGTFDSNGNNRIAMTTSSDDSIAAISLFGANGAFAGEINAYQGSGLTVFSNNLVLGSNNTANPISLQGNARFNGLATFNAGVNGLGVDDVDGLSAQLSSLQSQIDTLRAIFNNHTHSVTTANHNHGNPQNQPNTGGGTFTTTTP